MGKNQKASTSTLITRDWLLIILTEILLHKKHPSSYIVDILLLNPMNHPQNHHGCINQSQVVRKNYGTARWLRCLPPEAKWYFLLPAISASICCSHKNGGWSPNFDPLTFLGLPFGGIYIYIYSKYSTPPWFLWLNSSEFYDRNSLTCIPNCSQKAVTSVRPLMAERLTIVMVVIGYIHGTC